ncbi:MAG: 30S ribosomal protein S6 [Candidatus Poribacteria bacterium]|nr:30S ribosomal protein S6 [Candidatus Poribacteria bacterium]
MRQYETIFIISPELDESETNDVIEGVKETIESIGGKILKVDPWGRKRLAYTVKRHSDGFYVLVVFESNPEAVRQLNSSYQITESIIKHMTVRFEGDLTPPTSSHTEGPHEEESTGDSPDDRPSRDFESGNEGRDSDFRDTDRRF